MVTKPGEVEFALADPCGVCGGCQMMEQLKATLATIDELYAPTLKGLEQTAKDFPKDSHPRDHRIIAARREAWRKFKRAQEEWMNERDRIIRGLAPHVICHQLPIIYVTQTKTEEKKNG